MSRQKENQLETEKVGMLIAKFSLPAIISMLVSSLYNIVDQIFIGQGVGILGNAATNIAFPVTVICTATALLLGIGSASNYNLKTGAGFKEEACEIIGCGLFLLGICGMVIFCVTLLFLQPLLYVFGVTKDVLPYATDYLGITAFGIPFLVMSIGGNHMIRADRSPTYSMICTMIGAVINTILDPIFIFIFHWGIKGAAWATVIGQMTSGLLVVVYFLFFKNLDLKKKDIYPKVEYIFLIGSLGMAACINQIAIAIVQITMNNTLRHYGAQSMYGTDIPIACAGIISKVNMVFMAICIGMSQGCQPIWGFNYGAENYQRVRETFEKCFRICLIVSILFFGAFQLFPRQIIQIFGGGTEAYYRFATRYFRIFLFFTFVNGIQPMCSGFFTSIGKAKLGIILSLTRQVLFLLPLIIIFPLFLGIDGVMYAGPISDAAAATVAVLFARRELNKMKI